MYAEQSWMKLRKQFLQCNCDSSDIFSCFYMHNAWCWPHIQCSQMMGCTIASVQLRPNFPGTVSIANGLSSLRLSASDTWVDRKFVWVSGKKERWQYWLYQEISVGAVQLRPIYPDTVSIANVLSSLRLTASDTWVNRKFVWVSGKKERWQCWLYQEISVGAVHV